MGYVVTYPSLISGVGNLRTMRFSELFLLGPPCVYRKHTLIPWRPIDYPRIGRIHTSPGTRMVHLMPKEVWLHILSFCARHWFAGDYAPFEPMYPSSEDEDDESDDEVSDWSDSDESSELEMGDGLSVD